MCVFWVLFVFLVVFSGVAATSFLLWDLFLNSVLCEWVLHLHIRQIKPHWRWAGCSRPVLHAHKSVRDFQSEIFQPLRAIDRVNGCLTHFGHSEDKIHGGMLRVDALKLHPLFEAVLYCWHSLRLHTQEYILKHKSQNVWGFVSWTELQFQLE